MTPEQMLEHAKDAIVKALSCRQGSDPEFTVVELNCKVFGNSLAQSTNGRSLGIDYGHIGSGINLGFRIIMEVK